MRATLFRSLSAVVCGLLVIVLVSSAFAQDGPRGRRGRGPGMGGPMGGGMGGGMGGAMLLQIEQVQKELQLTDEQKAELKKLSDAAMEEGRKAMEEGRKAIEGMDRDEMRKYWEDNRQKFQQQMAERMKKATEQVGQILKPEQLARLKQIELQVAGVQVLRRPAVQEQLSLTEDQKSQLQKIEEETREQMQAAFPRPGGGDDGERPNWEEMRKRMEKMREEVEKKCMAVLTPEQKKTLGEMMGEPFELDRSALRRGGMGPFGGRRGEGRRGDGEGRRGDGEGRRRGGRRGEGNRSEQI